MTAFRITALVAASLLAAPVLADDDAAENAVSETEEVSTTEATSATEDATPEADASAEADGEAATETADADAGSADETASEPLTPEEAARERDFSIALGVCGARVTALERFYRGAIERGHSEWEDSAENLLISKGVMIERAEERAEDGDVIAVTVMNQQIPILWDKLVAASKTDGDTLQKEHVSLRSEVVQCLDLFFKRDG